MVVKKRGSELYDRVLDFEKEWFGTAVGPRIQDLISHNLISATLNKSSGIGVYERRQLGEKFLRGMRDAWEDHNLAMNMTADVLMYLDRGFATDNSRPSIWNVTIGLFRDDVLRVVLPGVNELQDGIPSDQAYTVMDILNKVLLDHIEMEREGDVIDRNLIRNCVGMLELLCETDEEVEQQKLYLTVFEPLFLEESHKFYHNECARLLQEANTGTWLRQTQRRLDEEETRCQTTLSELSSAKIANVVEQELISDHLTDFLAIESTGLKAMIDRDRLEDLTILYQLIARVDHTKAALVQALQSRVMELGREFERAMVNATSANPQPAPGDGAHGDAAGEADEDAEDGDAAGPNGPTAASTDMSKAQKAQSKTAQITAAAIQWVNDVLTLKDKFDELVNKCFAQDRILSAAISQSFAQFINEFERSPEYVSLFIDDTLRRGARDKTDEEVQVVLERAIILIKYLSANDLFERYYQKHLGRRLLQDRSIGQDVEKLMISRMKHSMGNNFTQKFEHMFKDMDTSRDLSENYRKHIENLGAQDDNASRPDLSIKLLSSNFWPLAAMGLGAGFDDHNSSERVKCIYPREIQALKESFVAFYNQGRTGRVVTWVGATGSAEIKCNFPKVQGKSTGPLSKDRRYEITTSTYGMLVLLVFNDLADDESLTLTEIQEKTGVPMDMLRKTLAGFVLPPKSKLLLKEPVNKTIREGDRFRFNTSFVSKTIKIKAPVVNSLSRVEADAERKSTEKKNDETRGYQIDAALVRIMK
jgi:cullin 3